jgi:hypothetical protein
MSPYHQRQRPISYRRKKAPLPAYCAASALENAGSLRKGRETAPTLLWYMFTLHLKVLLQRLERASASDEDGETVTTKAASHYRLAAASRNIASF